MAALNEKMSGVNMEMIAEKEPLMAKHNEVFKEKLQTEGLLRGLKVSFTFPVIFLFCKESTI